MKNFQSHYSELKRLLHNQSGLDQENLREAFDKAVENAQQDIELLDFNDTDRDVVSALMQRIQRLHSLGCHHYVRDEISQLSFFPKDHVSLTFNSRWNQTSEAELYQPITKHLTEMMNKGGNFGPIDEPFYSGEIYHKVSEELMKDFVRTLTNATHKIANYIIENVSVNWAWKPDIYGFAYYTFEKFFEYTYYIIVEEDYELHFAPKSLYEAPVLSIPKLLERKMYEKESQLHDIIEDLLDFIENTDRCNSNNAIWIRTVMFNIGLAAFQTVCRTREF